MNTGASRPSRRLKRPTIRILDFCDGHEEPAGYYALGHYPTTQFRAAVFLHVAEEEGFSEATPTLDEEVAQAIQDAPVWRGYWRTIVKPGEDEEYYETVPKGKRHSYPVTVMHVSW